MGSRSGTENALSERAVCPGDVLNVPVPTPALELDALLRHLEIDAEFGDWPDAERHFGQARSAWAQLTCPLARRIAARGYLVETARSAAQLAEVIDQLQASIERCSGGDVSWLARRAIHLVETIERALA